MDLAFDVFFCDLERPEAILNNDDAFDKSGEILKLSLTFHSMTPTRWHTPKNSLYELHRPCVYVWWGDLKIPYTSSIRKTKKNRFPIFFPYGNMDFLFFNRKGTFTRSLFLSHHHYHHQVMWCLYMPNTYTRTSRQMVCKFPESERESSELGNYINFIPWAFYIDVYLFKRCQAHFAQYAHQLAGSVTSDFFVRSLASKSP